MKVGREKGFDEAQQSSDQSKNKHGLASRKLREGERI